MSLFTGNEQYLCLSNLSDAEQTVALTDLWEDRESGIVSDTVKIPAGGLCFLRRV